MAPETWVSATPMIQIREPRQPMSSFSVAALSPPSPAWHTAPGMGKRQQCWSCSSGCAPQKVIFDSNGLNCRSSSSRERRTKLIRSFEEYAQGITVRQSRRFHRKRPCVPHHRQPSFHPPERRRRIHSYFGPPLVIPFRTLSGSENLRTSRTKLVGDLRNIGRANRASAMRFL